MKNLTLLIPAKNERESLPSVLKELEFLNCEKKIILEPNDIETINSIKSFNCDLIYQTNNGYGDALIEGIKATQTEYFCIFNADGSFNPSEISEMMKKINIEKKDFLFASRYLKNAGSEDDTIVTLIGNYVFSLFGKVFFNLPINDILYTFVIGSTEKAKQLNLKQKDFRLCVELPIKIKKMNMSMASISSFERKRIGGKKKVNAIKDGFMILKHMIILFFKD